MQRAWLSHCCLRGQGALLLGRSRRGDRRRGEERVVSKKQREVREGGNGREREGGERRERGKGREREGVEEGR